MIREVFYIAIYKDGKNINNTPHGSLYPTSTQIYDAVKANGGDAAQVIKLHVLE